MDNGIDVLDESRVSEAVLNGEGLEYVQRRGLELVLSVRTAQCCSGAIVTRLTEVSTLLLVEQDSDCSFLDVSRRSSFTSLSGRFTITSESPSAR
jgi:hypothetical protein